MTIYFSNSALSIHATAFRSHPINVPCSSIVRQSSHHGNIQAIMPETSISPPAVTRPSKPVSEALLNEKWDHCLSSLLIRSSVGLGFGVVASVLIFKRRAWPAFVGVGFGAGRAYEECNSSFRRVGKDGIRVQRP
ncbi:hypothetical protein EYC84_004040 [Monilinia fructicola]|nr:hypothetical protein EYC84_004040 [Monilinia fructicola]